MPGAKLTDLMDLASKATGVDVEDMLLAKYVVCKDGRCEPAFPFPDPRLAVRTRLHTLDALEYFRCIPRLYVSSFGGT
jgi:hypothetical protein